MTTPDPTSYTPAGFVADATALLAEHGATDAGFAAVGERLRLLARQPGLIPEEHLAGLHGTGASATILHEGTDGTCALMLARFPAEAPTPVHNHNSWGIACVVRGRDRYLRWERLDDGADQPGPICGWRRSASWDPATSSPSTARHTTFTVSRASARPPGSSSSSAATRTPSPVRTSTRSPAPSPTPTQRDSPLRVGYLPRQPAGSLL